jgi:hypothetical protein
MGSSQRRRQAQRNAAAKEAAAILSGEGCDACVHAVSVLGLERCRVRARTSGFPRERMCLQFYPSARTRLPEPS